MVHSSESTARLAVLCRATSLSFVTVFVMGCGGPKSMLTHAPALTSLTVSPQTSTVSLGSTVQFRATGTFSDGSSQDETLSVSWKSSDTSVVSIDHQGLAKSLTTGTISVVAQYSSLSGSTSLSVSQPVIVSLSVTPSNVSLPQGTSAQLQATTVKTDGSRQDVTDSVTWTNERPDVVSIGPSGMAISKTPGNADLTASLAGMVATCRVVVVAPALTAISVSEIRSAIPLGTATQATAMGTYTDGSTHDLTNSVSWTSVPTGIVTIDNQGRAKGIATGKAVVRAESDTVRGFAPLTVTGAAMTSVEVLSGSALMPLGTKQQLTAQGIYTDGSMRDITTSVSWSSNSNSILWISPGGQAEARAIGSAAVSASAMGFIGKVILTVGSPALKSMSILPATQTIPLAGSIQLTSQGVFTDGTARDLTILSSWAIVDKNIASVTGAGIVTGQHVGLTIVTVELQGIQASATIEVVPIASTTYFSSAPTSFDTTIRVTNPGESGADLCAMIYVFNQNQQLAECCGCQVSLNGLRTLSLHKDLISNSLTGVQLDAGSLFLATSDYNSNPSCTPSSFTPTGMSIAWATHLQYESLNSAIVSETEFSRAPLPARLASALQAQCAFIEQLGSGRGICTCGTGN